MPVETEIDSALERVRAVHQSRVVDVLKRAHAARVVREVRVFSRDVDERERQIRIGERCCEGKEKLAESEDGFVGESTCR
jgi:hypothetical protein